MQPVSQRITEISEAEDMERTVRLAPLLNVEPLLREEITRKMDRVVSRVIRHMNSGTFTPDEAMLAWAEVKTLRELLTMFSSSVKVSQSAAQRQAAKMNGED